jgi:hypothetical protein
MTVEEIKTHIEKQTRIEEGALRIAREVEGYDEVFFMGKVVALKELYSWIRGQEVENTESITKQKGKRRKGRFSI